MSGGDGPARRPAGAGGDKAATDRQLAFEREKWAAEMELRRRDLDIRDAELRRSQWSSPLIIAIFTAAAAAVGNLGVTLANGRSAASLETIKAEQALVLESIKADSAERVAINLGFLVDTGLISNETRAAAIRRYLSGRSPAQLPFLPSAGTAGIELRSEDSCNQFAREGFRVARAQATPADFNEIAAEAAIEPAALRAVWTVAGVRRPMADGRVPILFERHIFSRLTEGRYDAEHPDISSRAPGAYGSMGGQYDRLSRAARLNCAAALAATSWGTFQILGRNYRAAGYEAVDEFVRASLGSERKDIEAVVALVRSTGALDALRAKDWPRFARAYHGPGYRQARYDEKYAQAYEAARQSR